LRNILPLIACRGSLANNTSTAICSVLLDQRDYAIGLQLDIRDHFAIV
jgi:hypothetical protein